MDVSVILSKDAASRSTGLDSAPAVAVAAPCAIIVNAPRSVAAPFTSSVAAGVVVPMPTLPSDSEMAEGSTAQGAANLATWLAVAVPSLVTLVHAVSGAALVAAAGFVPEALTRAGTADLANKNAEAGRPPSVSASPAFKAYGALTSCTRGCSACPSIEIPTQWACAVLNRSAGRPSDLVAPSSTV